MKRLSVVLAAGFLAACGRTEQVAGGGSDQPNKISAGRILTETGTPASGVQVQSWVGVFDPQHSNQIAKVLDSGVSDNDGNWRLRVPDSGSWFVVGRIDGYIAVFKKGESEARLQAVAVYHGSIKPGPGLILDAVWLGGSSGPLVLDADGHFSISTEPGPQRLWARLRWATGVDTVLVKDRVLSSQYDNSDSALVADTGNVLLASSESSPMRSALRGVDFPADDSDAAKWFAFNDQYLHGTSLVNPIGFPDSDSALISDMGGRYFAWPLQLGAPIPLKDGGSWPPFAGVGLRLSRRDLDWSGVKYLKMTARGGLGSQKIIVQMNTSAADRLEPGSQLQYTVSLPGGWDTILVPLDSLKPPSGSQSDSQHLAWKDVRDGVHDLVFYAGSPVVRFELREVRAIGNRIERW